MELKNPAHDETRSLGMRLEDAYRDVFSPVGDDLKRVFQIHKERKNQKSAFIQTVVTYGAYEEPI